MLWAIGISIVLVAVTTVVQREIFRIVASLTPDSSDPADASLLFVMPGVFVAHLINIGLYAVAFAYMQDRPDLGSIAGEAGTALSDFFYLSLTSYTTVGFGDVYASGPMRIVSGMESLSGLLLIGWSASFTYTVHRK